MNRKCINNKSDLLASHSAHGCLTTPEKWLAIGKTAQAKACGSGLKKSVLLILAACLLSTSGKALAAGPIVYPKARVSDQVDNYHGTKVPDPYRWLEGADTEEINTWIAAENKLTFGLLDQIPERDQIKKRLTKLWNYERFGLPTKHGDRYFYSKNNGLQNQSVWYWLDALDGTPKVLIDPNTLSKDGTVALGGLAFSDDGHYVAYGLSTSGSDWRDWHVRHVESGQDLADHLKWVKFSGVSWTKDGKGFFYSRYDEPNEASLLQDVNYFQKLFYHKLSTPQSKDVLVYDRPDHKDWGFGGEVTDDGNYLVISVSKGTLNKNMVFYKRISDGTTVSIDTIKSATVHELINEFEAQYSLIDNDGPIFYFQTDSGAARSRLMAIDTRTPQRRNWKEIIPESDATLRSVSSVGGKFIASYLRDARSEIKVFDFNGQLEREIKLPGIGSARGFGGKRHEAETFYSYNSFTDPGTIFRYDIESGKSTVFRQPKVSFHSNDYETKQVFYRSKDGTRVPMFISYRKGIKLDGQNPTYLYGYGGFNISLTPRFSIANLVWMEMGGVYAQPNLRGGGEYGREWHLSGTKLKKQNVFDDFIAAAQWLIDHKYTSTPKLAIGGGSNGGLLVGATMTQRPDLFGACLPAVGVMDMLRFHKFTIGWAWTSDYGSSKNPEEFKALYAYSPLHNIKPGTAYPATMITTADHDDRVVPAHSFKFAATLQAAHSGSTPVLIRIQTKAGHGAGKPTTMIIQEVADKWAFLVKSLHMKLHDNM